MDEINHIMEYKYLKDLYCLLDKKSVGKIVRNEEDGIETVLDRKVYESKNCPGFYVSKTL